MTAKKVAIKVEYKKGDKVKVLSVVDDFPIDKVGSIGTVVNVYTGDRREIGVEFDFKDGHFHNCDIIGKEGHCYWFDADKLEPAKRSHKKKEPMVDRSVTPFVAGDVVEFVEKYQQFNVGDRITVSRLEEWKDTYCGHEVKWMIYHETNGAERGVFDFRLKLAKVAKSTPISPELVEDPRTFYKVIRIDGAPANGSARGTGFKYTLPVERPTEWTPTINDISLCEKGYHVIEAKDIKRWVTIEYSGTDTLVCECKARGEIKVGDNKCVAQSIQLTKILYRWKDAENTYLKAMKEFEQTANDRAIEVNARAEKEKMEINQECHDAKQAYADKFFAIGR